MLWGLVEKRTFTICALTVRRCNHTAWACGDRPGRPHSLPRAPAVSACLCSRYRQYLPGGFWIFSIGRDLDAHAPEAQGTAVNLHRPVLGSWNGAACV